MKRTPLTRKTPLRRTPRSGLAAARMKTGGSWARSTRKKLSEAALKAVRPLLRERAGGVCEKCGGALGRGGDAHHRLKRSGPERDVLSNLVMVCRGCHSWVHANPSQAREDGWILTSKQAPADVPVRFAQGLVRLDDEGGVTPL